MVYSNEVCSTFTAMNSRTLLADHVYICSSYTNTKMYSLSHKHGFHSPSCSSEWRFQIMNMRKCSQLSARLHRSAPTLRHVTHNLHNATLSELPVGIYDYWVQIICPYSGVFQLTKAIKINSKYDATFQGQDRSRYSAYNRNTNTVGQAGKPTLRGSNGDRRCSRMAACYFLFVLYQFLSV